MFIAEKGRLRKQIPSITLKLSLIAGKTTDLTYLERMLKMFTQITGDQVIHLYLCRTLVIQLLLM